MKALILYQRVTMFGITREVTYCIREKYTSTDTDKLAALLLDFISFLCYYNVIICGKY